MSRNLPPARDRAGPRVSLLACAIALALGGADALALGVGGLRVQSALNQPFVGEIDLLDVKPDELDTVKAQIAGAEEFAQVGAERYHYLTKLRFTPQISPRGDTIIRVASREPIREPFMNFLVEVVWPKGRLVREYTVLLDPPVTAARRAPRVEPPAAPRREVSRPAEPAPSRPRTASAPPPRESTPPPPPVSPPPAAPVSRTADGDFPKRVGPVRPGNGLWRIALNNTPKGATVAQTAMALYRNNQGAFIRGDINRIIVGKRLTIPSAAELFALSPDAAQREFEAALRGEQVKRAPIASTSPDAGAAPAAGDDSRLRIAGTAASQTRSGDAQPSLPENPEEMERELLLVREASESARQETQELRDRIHELETQLTEIQQLLRLRNAELARIQGADPASLGPADADAALAAAPGESIELESVLEEAVPDSPAPLPDDLERALAAAGGLIDDPSPLDSPIDAPPPEAEAPAEGAESLPGLAASHEGSADPRTDEQAPAVTPEPGPAPAPAGQPAVPPEGPAVAAVETADPKALDSTWHQLLLPLAGVAGLTALGIGAFSWVRARRRRGEEGFAETDSADMSAEAVSGESPFAAGFGSAAGRPAAAAPDSDDVPAVDSPSSAFAAIGRTDPETDEADVISEADIYIAYGRYREAEDLLRDEMNRAPERVELKLKLAEAYFGAKNHQALRDLMDEMRAQDQGRIHPDQWQRLAEMVAATDSRSRPEAGAGRSTPGAGRAAPAADIDPEGSVEEYFSLDISDAERPSADLSLNTVLEDSERPRPAAPPRKAPGPLPMGNDSYGSPILEDDPPLLADDDAFTRSLALDAHSDGLGLDIPSAHAVGREFSGGVSDLELTIDDLRAASDVDLESFVDSTRTLSTLADDLTLERADPLDTLTRSTQTQAMTTEAAPRTGGSGLPGLDVGKEESASSDLLSSQWQMDSGLWDETATKLDLARAYMEMSDKDAARGILEEVVAEGNEAQRTEAKELLHGLG